MPGPLIRLGDKTSHGGTVLEASQHSGIGGIGIARVGDKASCPMHGNSHGKAASRHEYKTGCGAVLMAGQQISIDNV